MPGAYHKDLGDLQLRFLRALCTIGEGTVYDLLEALPEEERTAYTTVLTVMRSLEKRGLVTHTTRDRSYVYQPLQSPEEVQCGLLGRMVERVFGGSTQLLVARLLEQESLSREELEDLQQLIAEKARELEQRREPE
jgi:predicted transcriptional regulator